MRHEASRARTGKRRTPGRKRDRGTARARRRPSPWRWRHRSDCPAPPRSTSLRPQRLRNRCRVCTRCSRTRRGSTGSSKTRSSPPPARPDPPLARPRRCHRQPIRRQRHFRSHRHLRPTIRGRSSHRRATYLLRRLSPRTTGIAELHAGAKRANANTAHAIFAQPFQVAALARMAEGKATTMPQPSAVSDDWPPCAAAPGDETGTPRLACAARDGET